ncbi:MAG: BlaI/MecI/CopY family transcriptional regulator [Candidatus Omnitrophica bacterium]|nr:BlaI/MecI/CopY family transcriptional regulator [Candidatus Omnitrophota bacterium]
MSDKNKKSWKYKSNIPKPTEAELAILEVLWRLGPSTVRDVLNEFRKDREVGYTTVLKMLQIMTQKELVDRDESSRSHTYRARYEMEQTQDIMVKDLIARAFSGSVQQLIKRALSVKRISKKEKEELKGILDEMS